jgi:hypothetical protein
VKRPKSIEERDKIARRCSIVLGMSANFRELAAYSGVDESLPTGGQGIVVPNGGSTLMILEDGRGLDVRSTVPSKVYVYGFKAKQERAAAARNASNPSEAMRRFDDGFWRTFRIKADAPVGFDTVRVEAKNPKAHKVEATLKVIVLDKKTVKVDVFSSSESDGRRDRRQRHHKCQRAPLADR